MSVLLKSFSTNTAKRYISNASTREKIAQIIRVNHAGENGADVLYASQMAILGSTSEAGIVKHMWDQEKVHKQRFEELLVKYRVRPSLLNPLWSALGYTLTAALTMAGPQAAMASTVAVETVIVEHYNDQLRRLLNDEELLKFRDEYPEDYKTLIETIKTCRDEEQEHHDHGLEHGAKEAPFYGALTEAVKFVVRGAINLSTKV